MRRARGGRREPAGQHPDARWQHRPGWAQIRTVENDLIAAVSAQRYGHEIDEATRAHITGHDPARALREVEGKRRIDRLATVIGDPINHDIRSRLFAENLLQLNALPYADRPGYWEVRPS